MGEAIIGGIIGGIIGNIIGNLAASQIIKECSRFSSVRVDLDWIVSEMRHIQSYLEDAEAKQFRTKGVSNFIRDIWDLAYDVEDIIDTYFPKTVLSWSRGKRHLDFRIKRIARGFVKEVEGIRKRAADIRDARQTFGIDESRRSCEEGTWDQRRSFPHIDEPNVVGFDNLIKSLEHKVLDNDNLHHCVVSIIGFPGLGKTTLARKVYNSARKSKVYNSDRQRFDCAAWICVSESPNVEKLLQDIAGQVGLEKDKIEHNVEANLYEFLSRKRYVIVIDDIWHTRAWNALRIGLPTNSENGSRIILTSRHTDMGVYVGGRDSVILLEPLDQETSRRLFYKLIVDDLQNICKTQDPPQLQKIGEQILEKCGGVPLAIVLAAGLLKLRERSETVWKGVLEDMGQGKDQCTEIVAFLALSYKDLPLNLKPCFLYFGIFPEDREVEAFDLINLWAAEGFIRGSNVREVEEVGEEYLNHLIARNLIQVVQRRYNGRVRRVRIHDMMHKLCTQVANEINLFNIHTNEINCNTALKVRRVAIHGNGTDHNPASYQKTSSLRAVFCFVRRYPWNSNANKNLLRDSKFLRVLSVEEGNDIPRCVLTEICNLRQLTYLKLGFPYVIVHLPHAISNLKSLLTLDVRELLIVSLPNAIWSMEQLRHILLPFQCHVSFFRRVTLDVFYPVEVSLPNLQTLYGLPGDLSKADWLHRLTSLRTLRVNLKKKDIIGVLSDAKPVSDKLEELSLVGDFLHPPKATSFNFSRYELLSELLIEGIKLNELSHDRLPPNLTELTLVRTELTTDPIEALKKLEKLKFLKLSFNSYLGKELVCSGEPGNFPQLEVLEMEDLHNLEMVEVGEGGMPRLRDFRILHFSPGILNIPHRLRIVMSH